MKVRFPIILRIAGLAGVIVASLGIFMALYGLLAFRALDPSVFATRKAEIDARVQERVAAMPEYRGREAPQLDPEEMKRTASSPRFHAFFYAFTAFGLVFNFFLFRASRRLLRANPTGVRLLVILMLVYVAYFYSLPILHHLGLGPLIRSSPEWLMPFASAWGIGNFGLMPLLLTYFWLWGPILVLIGRGMPMRSLPTEGALADVHP